MGFVTELQQMGSAAFSSSLETMDYAHTMMPFPMAASFDNKIIRHPE